MAFRIEASTYCARPLGGPAGTNSALIGSHVGGRFRIVGVTRARPAAPESPVRNRHRTMILRAWVQGLDANGRGL